MSARPWRWLCVLPLLLLLGLLAFLSARQLVAGVYSNYGMGLLVTGEDLNVATEALRIAHLLEPGNPDYAENRALLLNSPEDIDRIVEQYVLSFETRPAWPYSWGNLAARLAEGGDYGARLDYALQQAATLGPDEVKQNQAFAALAVEHWYDLSTQAREIVADSMKSVLDEDPRSIQEYVQARRRAGLLCGLFGTHEALAEWCGERLRGSS